MKIKLEELYAVNNLLQKDGTIEVDITIAGDRIAFEGKKYILVVREEMPDCDNPRGWIPHDGSNHTPTRALAHGIIEVVANGDTREKSHSMHPTNVKWNNIKEWRVVK